MEINFNHPIPENKHTKREEEKGNDYHNLDAIPIGANIFCRTLSYGRVRSYVSLYGKKNGYLMATKQCQDENGNRGIRIWKVRKVNYRHEPAQL